jgi:hypothetical protein
VSNGSYWAVLAISSPDTMPTFKSVGIGKKQGTLALPFVAEEEYYNSVLKAWGAGKATLLPVLKTKHADRITSLLAGVLSMDTERATPARTRGTPESGKKRRRESSLESSGDPELDELAERERVVNELADTAYFDSDAPQLFAAFKKQRDIAQALRAMCQSRKTDACMKAAVSAKVASMWTDAQVDEHVAEEVAEMKRQASESKKKMQAAEKSAKNAREALFTQDDVDTFVEEAVQTERNAKKKSARRKRKAESSDEHEDNPSDEYSNMQLVAKMVSDAHKNQADNYAKLMTAHVGGGRGQDGCRVRS